jgi:phenylacetate-CoA ligase
MRFGISPVNAWLEKKTQLFSGELSPETLWQFQRKLLKNTLEYVRDNSRFYRRMLKDLKIEDINSFHDLERIPFTYDKDLRSNPNELACVPQSKIEKIATLFTSGSTGEPKRVFFTVEDLEVMVEFFACGMSTMVAKGDQVLILMPADAEWGIGDILKKGLSRIGVSSTEYGPVRDTEDAVFAVRRNEVDCLVGIPVQVYMMAKTDGTLRPKSVLLSADYVPEAIVNAIKDTWHCEVFTHYGLTESGLAGGVECRAHRGYHMRDADLLFEIINPETGLHVKDGEYGEIVFTTLNRRGMPLIRYRTGDISRVLTGKCRCGMNIQRLDKVLGRFEKMIRFPNQETLSIYVLDEAMYKRPDVLDYTAKLVCENGQYTLYLSVKSAEDIAPDELAAYAAKKLHLTIPIVVDKGEGFFTKGVVKRQIVIENK